MSCHRLDVQLTPDVSWSFSSSVSQKSPLSTHSLLDWTLFLEWLVMAVSTPLSATLVAFTDSRTESALPPLPNTLVDSPLA
jgi:hypothetical protein